MPQGDNLYRLRRVKALVSRTEKAFVYSSRALV